MRRPSLFSSNNVEVNQFELIQGFQLLRARLRSGSSPIHQKSFRDMQAESTRLSTSSRIRFRTSGETVSSRVPSRYSVHASRLEVSAAKRSTTGSAASGSPEPALCRLRWAGTPQNVSSQVAHTPL